jgi:hypothetical protein
MALTNDRPIVARYTKMPRLNRRVLRFNTTGSIFTWSRRSSRTSHRHMALNPMAHPKAFAL